MKRRILIYISLITIGLFLSCKKGNWCDCTSETTNFQGTNTVLFSVNLDTYEGGTIKNCSDLDEVTDTVDNKTDTTSLKVIIKCKPR